ncbi:hypothetical protein HYPSUDRAFT_167771 [Hypholoma sublateritium FD-334 SS-4]|uniref:Smr domain-containing protein n=1 Tax=Hypholoma sublateritium (strain FD-334 SS-4) TaxID=945553 RepID=A0A0D2NM50_HYPSF|nr:hypothetical protein HYPSUDRAFT_167771 [Hypholoma sublateritium FD-334 SS-4]
MSMWLQLFQTVLNLFCAPKSPDKPQQPAQGPPQHAQQPQWQPSPPHISKPHTKPPGKNYQDANQINQNNEYYVSLRAQANEHGDEMAKAFRESHEAYENGDRALAKELSNKGKDHQRKMEQLNKQASDYIFVENNKDSAPDEIDLHGLYVKEAISRVEQAIQSANLAGETQLNLIVGKGLHSTGGVAKIKPAIADLIQKYNLTAQIDPNNSGVLIVLLQSSGQRGIGADEISRRLERSDEGCTIM